MKICKNNDLYYKIYAKNFNIYVSKDVGYDFTK